MLDKVTVPFWKNKKHVMVAFVGNGQFDLTEKRQNCAAVPFSRNCAQRVFNLEVQAIPAEFPTLFA